MASSFEIFYGKRRILPKTSFTARQKLVSQRTKYLENVAIRIERQRQKILADQRVKRAKQREKVKRAAVKKKHVRERKKKVVQHKKKRKKELDSIRSTKRRIRNRPAFKRALKKRPEKEIDMVLQSHADLKSEKMDIANTYYEKAKTLEKVTVSQVKIIPIKTKSKLYKKKILQKFLTRDEVPDELYILDFNLIPREYIEISQGPGFKIGVGEAYAMFSAHIHDFFEKYGKERPRTILRIKYVWEKENTNELQHSAISRVRAVQRSKEDMTALLFSTINKLQGMIEIGAGHTKNYFEKLSGVLWITGFTLEFSGLENSTLSWKAQGKI